MGGSIFFTKMACRDLGNFSVVIPTGMRRKEKRLCGFNRR